jgi:PKD repeat protein
VQRIALVLAVVAAVGSVTFGGARAGGQTAAASGPLLGITGQVPRFQSQTGQESNVVQAFLGWEQGHTWGSRFAALFPTLGPIPMIHLGTKGQNKKEAITPGAIAAGKGDDYFIALNQAISAWGKGIYIRPMAEMNSAGTAYSGYQANGRPKDAAHSPASYRKAFARIYVILHGGSVSAIDAKLRQLGLPPLQGGADLPSNPFPRLRVLWSPLASDNPRVPGNAAVNYFPGDAYVDVAGADIYDERLTDTAPWLGLEKLFKFARAHHKPFSVPEWGMFSIDDDVFVKHMCTFLKTHRATETAEFYESKPGSIFDLEPKPKSRALYRSCITPLGGPLPSWATPAAPMQIALTLTPSPPSGPAPLTVQFSIVARLSVPIAHWQVLFGDGTMQEGDGPPPPTLPQTYAQDGTYHAVLIVYPGPPFAPESAQFVATADVTVGTGAPAPVTFTPTPTAGAAPLKVSFQTDLNVPAGVASWEVVLGDGNTLQGTGTPPHFTGHTYTKPGNYRVLLVLHGSSGSEYVEVGTVAVAAPPAGQASGTPTGTVTLNGRPFTGGPVPFGAKIDVTHGTLKLTTSTGTVVVYGNGVFAAFILLRGTDKGKPIVEFRLTAGNFAVCNRKLSSVDAPKPPPKVVRQLWAKATGHFRTRGRYASATVRGTVWLVADRCDGTLTHVNKGVVQVSDFTTRKLVTVRAGKTYLAKKP